MSRFERLELRYFGDAASFSFITWRGTPIVPSYHSSVGLMFVSTLRARSGGNFRTILPTSSADSPLSSLQKSSFGCRLVVELTPKSLGAVRSTLLVSCSDRPSSRCRNSAVGLTLVFMLYVG